MKKWILLGGLGITALGAQNRFPTAFENSGGQATATYAEGLDWYRRLDAAFPSVKMLTKGPTDSGEPLHLVLFSPSQSFDLAKLKARGKSILLINNGIHAGEPDGIDASMLLLRDLVLHPERFPALQEVVVAIIPFYNIGGVLQRRTSARVNQNGPLATGTRGNARNYDLNRDFIKADTRNAASFAAIFQELDPDLFLDTHVSNGADYQYTMTLCYTQEEKLGGDLGAFHAKVYLPFLYQELASAGYPATPYVNAFARTPDQGFSQFIDWPRYSTGYAALFHTIGIMAETHMLKPFQERVLSTKALLGAAVRFLGQEGATLRRLRATAKAAVAQQERFPLNWKLNRDSATQIFFQGYTPEYPLSPVSGQPRLFYNRQAPLEQRVPFFDTYEPDNWVRKPQAYVIPQGWHPIISRLQQSGVVMRRLRQDSTMRVTAYYIDGFSPSKVPYEGHFQHTELSLRPVATTLTFRAGDYFIPLNQWRNRFIVEVLEPLGVDSYFRWNFFDAILQEKEGYSGYVFEEVAADLLANDAALRQAWTEKKQTDPEFAKNGRAQLEFIYQRSVYAEPAYRRYPVFRVE